MTEPRQPKEIVLSAIEALTDGRYQDYLAHLAQDVRFYTIGSTPYSGLIVGRDMVWEKILKKTTVSIDPNGYREEIIAVLCDGDQVAVRSRGYETMTSGTEYNNEYACFYRVEDGLISEINFYLDTDLLIRSKK